METLHPTSPVPTDRWFALPFLIIGAAGILPALYIMGWLLLSIVEGNRMPHDAPLGAPLLLCGAGTLFTWGMTLFFGYMRALSARPWPRRVMLWRATVAYNALLGLGGLVITSLANPLPLLWFAALITLASFALKRAAHDDAMARAASGSFD
jgi:hypothetical protein